MVLYAIPYEKDISNRPLRCPVDPFAILLTHPKSRRKITHPLLARCLRRHLLRGKKRLPLAAFAPRLPSVVYRLLPFQEIPTERAVAPHPQSLARCREEQGRQGSPTDGGHSGFPKASRPSKNRPTQAATMPTRTSKGVSATFWWIPWVFRSRFTSVRPTYKIGSGRSVFWPE